MIVLEGGPDSKHSKNMDYLMNYWHEIINSKLKNQEALFSEGGPLKPDDLQGEFDVSSSKIKMISCKENNLCCFIILFAA